MRNRNRTLLLAAIVLLGLASISYAPPPGARPAPRPAPPTFRPPPPPPTFRPTPPSMTKPGLPNLPGIRPTPITYRPRGEVVREIGNIAKTSPAKALGRLSTPEAHAQLTQADRAALGASILRSLATKIEARAGNQALFVALHEADLVRAESKHLLPQHRAELVHIGRAAENRLLADGLREVREVAEQGHWELAAGKANLWLNVFNQRTEAGKWLADVRASANLAQAELILARGLALQLQQVGRVEGLLRGTAKGLDLAALQKFDPSGLSAPLAQRMEGLRGLAEVKTLAQAKSAPNVAEAKAAVARLERGLEGVLEGEKSLARMVQQELATRAFLNGHTEAASELLPKDGPPEHAAALLRDLKVLALGGGQVETQVGRDAVAAAGEGPAAPRPPPGLEPLIPEGAREGWRPPVAEPAGANLPPLARAEAATAKMQEKALAEVATQREQLRDKTEAARTRLASAYQTVTQPAARARRTMATAAASLNRDLTPRESLLVRQRVLEHKPTLAILDELQVQAALVDRNEDAFLDEVAAQLGEPLTQEQRDQVRALRDQRRTVADVVALLRLRRALTAPPELRE